MVEISALLSSKQMRKETHQLTAEFSVSASSYGMRMTDLNASGTGYGLGHPLDATYEAQFKSTLANARRLPRHRPVRYRCRRGNS